MATLYGSGKGCVRLVAGLQILIGILLFVFGIVVAALLCHWTSRAGFGIWIGIVVVITAAVGLWSCSVRGQQGISIYAGLSILCAFLSLILCISYGTAVSDFYDEFYSNTEPVDKFYSRQYVAVYMRTSYYKHCISSETQLEIERERTGVIDIVKPEQDTERKLLNEIQRHGRKGLGFAAVFICLACFEFIFSCSGVLYACTAAGWLNKRRDYNQAKSAVTVHHSRAGGLL